MEAMILLLSAGADTEIKNDYNVTPLHCAALYGYKQGVSILLSFGADAASVLNESQDRPINDPEMRGMLLRAPAYHSAGLMRRLLQQQTEPLSEQRVCEELLYGVWRADMALVVYCNPVQVISLSFTQNRFRFHVSKECVKYVLVCVKHIHHCHCSASSTLPATLSLSLSLASLLATQITHQVSQ